MRIPPFVAGLLAVLGTVAGGLLECSPARQAWEQHRGRAVYGRMCVVCHGMDGEGYKADQAPAIGSSDYLRTASDEFLRRAINDGRAGTTMSAWGLDKGGPLKPREVDETIAYLRTMQDGPRVALDERPASGDARRGVPLYGRACAKCHGASGKGGQYLAIGGGQLLQSASDGFLRYAIQHGRPQTAMPAFGASLAEGEVEDIVALLRDWQKKSPPQRASAARPPPIPLGPVPLNPNGPEPVGFQRQPQTTKAEVIKRELDRGAKLAFLDARAPSDYTNEHISGAVSVPFYDPDQYFAGLPRDAWLVCYCSCPHAESGQLASKLVAHGFTKVTVLDEGLGFWRNKGYGTHSGIDP